MRLGVRRGPSGWSGVLPRLAMIPIDFQLMAGCLSPMLKRG